MSTTPVVQPHHLRRKAVIYIRQSTGHQVLTNIESQQLQRAMREQAHHLGWPDERIEIVETDLGQTAQSTQRRGGYQALLVGTPCLTCVPIINVSLRTAMASTMPPRPMAVCCWG